MVSNRRWGPESAETREALLDAAEKIMREEGYAAVKSRSLGKAAGLSPQIIYYYYRTMDELFVAMFRRASAKHMADLEKASEAENPLLAMWEVSADASRASVVSEFMAVANHRKSLQALISEFGEKFYLRQAEIVAREVRERRLNTGDWPPEIVAAVIEMVARGFAAGADYKIAGHTNARQFVTDRLRSLTEQSETPVTGVTGHG